MCELAATLHEDTWQHRRSGGGGGWHTWWERDRDTWNGPESWRYSTWQARDWGGSSSGWSSPQEGSWQWVPASSWSSVSSSDFEDSASKASDGEPSTGSDHTQAASEAPCPAHGSQTCGERWQLAQAEAAGGDPRKVPPGVEALMAEAQAQRDAANAQGHACPAAAGAGRHPRGDAGSRQPSAAAEGPEAAVSVALFERMYNNGGVPWQRCGKLGCVPCEKNEVCFVLEPLLVARARAAAHAASCSSAGAEARPSLEPKEAAASAAPQDVAGLALAEAVPLKSPPTVLTPFKAAPAGLKAPPASGPAVAPPLKAPPAGIPAGVLRPAPILYKTPPCCICPPPQEAPAGRGAAGGAAGSAPHMATRRPSSKKARTHWNPTLGQVPEELDLSLGLPVPMPGASGLGLPLELGPREASAPESLPSAVAAPLCDPGCDPGREGNLRYRRDPEPRLPGRPDFFKAPPPGILRPGVQAPFKHWAPGVPYKEPPPRSPPTPAAPHCASAAAGAMPKREQPPQPTPKSPEPVQQPERVATGHATFYYHYGDDPGLVDPNLVMDLDFFKTWQHFTKGFTQHNAALKYLRHVHELPENPMESMSLLLSGPVTVEALVHGPRTAFTFDEFNTSEWDWREMVAQLEEPDMEWLVGEHHLTKCELAVRPGSYDVARHYHLAKEENMPNQTTQLPRWDFLVTRSDGESFRLHPEYTVRSFDVFPRDPEPVVPKRLGRSEGPGTFRAQKDAGKLGRKMKFDWRKEPRPAPQCRVWARGPAAAGPPGSSNGA